MDKVWLTLFSPSFWAAFFDRNPPMLSSTGTSPTNSQECGINTDLHWKMRKMKVSRSKYVDYYLLKLWIWEVMCARLQSGSKWCQMWSHDVIVTFVKIFLCVRQIFFKFFNFSKRLAKVCELLLFFSQIVNSWLFMNFLNVTKQLSIKIMLNSSWVKWHDDFCDHFPLYIIKVCARYFVKIKLEAMFKFVQNFSVTYCQFNVKVLPKVAWVPQ